MKKWKKSGLAFLSSLALAFTGMSLNSAVTTEAAAPVIQSVQVTELSSAGYRVTVGFYSDSGVRNVQMPTWTDANGQDDLIWHEASVSGNSASFYVPVSAHKNESGNYTTHVYVYNNQGQYGIYGVNTTVPTSSSSSVVGSGGLSIGNITVSEVSKDGYRVTAKLNSSNGVSKVEMPTWTSANGQDDLIWHQASVSGDTATFYVSASAHKNEGGEYITHVYLYDNAGNKTIAGTGATLPSTAASTDAPPTITGVTVSEVSAAGYRVTAKINAPAGVKEVVMPTWTSANGQDDLIWHQATVSGDTASFYVSASAHKGESGEYITHVYLRDVKGREALVGSGATLPTAQDSGNTSSQEPSIGNVTITELTSSGYRVTAQLSAPNGVSKVEMPTWTSANGQDDLIWHQASVSGNTATFYVPASSHKNESGTYITHIYLYDNAGKKAIKGVEATVPTGSQGIQTGGGGTSLLLSIPFITTLNSSGYTIQVTFSAPSGARRIAAAVWTQTNGQDDLVWHDMTISGNKATVFVPVSSHNNEHGIYNTNVYIWDYAGGQKMTAAAVPVP